MQIDGAQGYSQMWHDTTKMHERQPHPSRAGNMKRIFSDILMGCLVCHSTKTKTHMNSWQNVVNY